MSPKPGSSKVLVFLGPTLPVEHARSVLEADYRPPVQCGDICRAAQDDPFAIGIIDGFFQQVPAVWHKEILWALSRGIHVFGSASMGALRAAELHTYGMKGVGRVFEQFRDGVLTDDDEVAVAHGDATTGYQAISHALVNLRATLQTAHDAGLIEVSFQRQCLALAKQEFYPKRHIKRLLQRARERALDSEQISRLERALPDIYVDQKRLDALDMCRRISEALERRTRPKPRTFPFQYTDAFDALREQVASEIRVPAGGAKATELGRDLPYDVVTAHEVSPLVEELVIEGDYREATAGALTRALAMEVTQGHRFLREAPILEDAARRFRAGKQLADPSALRHWFRQERMEEAQFERWVQSEARLAYVEQTREPATHAQLTDYLRSQSRFGALMDRHEAKASFLARFYGGRQPLLADTGLDEPQLWQWFFESCMGRDIPPDLEAYAQQQGHTGKTALRRTVIREYCYRHQAHATLEPEST